MKYRFTFPKVSETGNKIMSIKIIRSVAGIGLKEAKEDGYEANEKIGFYDFYSALSNDVIQDRFLTAFGSSNSNPMGYSVVPLGSVTMNVAIFNDLAEINLSDLAGNTMNVKTNPDNIQIAVDAFIQLVS